MHPVFVILFAHDVVWLVAEEMSADITEDTMNVAQQLAQMVQTLEMCVVCDCHVRTRLCSVLIPCIGKSLLPFLQTIPSLTLFLSSLLGFSNVKWFRERQMPTGNNEHCTFSNCFK